VGHILRLHQIWTLHKCLKNWKLTVSYNIFRSSDQRTWDELTTARSHRLVFLGDLGEIPNWGVLVDDSRHWLLCWVHNYLAEQAGSVIYSRLERWPVNLRETRGGRRRRRLLARWFVAYYRGKLSNDHRTANVSHDGEVNVPRHVEQGHVEAICGEPIQIHRGMLGYGGRSKIVAGAYPRRDIYGSPVLSNWSERESPRR
jgi:hypothetical protein